MYESHPSRMVLDGRAKPIAHVLHRLRNSSVFVLPHVICKPKLNMNLSKNNKCNAHNANNVNNNLVSQGFRFKAHEPENVVDHVYNVLVQDIHSLEEGTILGAAKKTTVMRESEYNGQLDIHDLHINFSIQKFIEGRLVNRMPYRHFEVIDQERANRFI
jgi:hypothetical protein